MEKTQVDKLCNEIDNKLGPILGKYQHSVRIEALTLLIELLEEMKAKQ